MTAEELRIVESSKESRQADARRCRLAAFGAALRSRCYDTDKGFNTDALERALRAILHTQSLVGPLEQIEIDFFVEWLGRAYRSKSRLLGFGEDNIPVARNFFCLHVEDNSPKYELGSRPLPGKNPLPTGQIFEDPVREPDDFLRAERSEEGELLDVEPFQEINYKHCGNIREDRSVDKKRPVPSSDIPRAHQPKRQRTATSHPKIEPQESQSGYPFVDAIIYQKELKQSLQRIVIRGRPPNIINLRVVVKVGGEAYDPTTIDLNASSAKSDDDVYSSIFLEDALPHQTEFLNEIGINSAEAFMAAPLQQIADSLVTYREKHGLAALKGRNILDGASKTVCSWRSRVRSYARKGLGLKQEQFDECALLAKGTGKRGEADFTEQRETFPVAIEAPVGDGGVVEDGITCEGLSRARRGQDQRNSTKDCRSEHCNVNNKIQRRQTHVDQAVKELSKQKRKNQPGIYYAFVDARVLKKELIVSLQNHVSTHHCKKFQRMTSSIHYVQANHLARLN
jgi:hypothetical protein